MMRINEARPWALLVSFFAGALFMLAGLWVVVGYPDVEHVRVRVSSARVVDAGIGKVELLVDSCNGAPRATMSDTGNQIEIEVKAFRFKREEDDCQDTLEVFIDRRPLPTEFLDAQSRELIPIEGTR